MRTRAKSMALTGPFGCPQTTRLPQPCTCTDVAPPCDKLASRKGAIGSMKLECGDGEADAEMQQHGNKHEREKRGWMRLNMYFGSTSTSLIPLPLHLHEPRHAPGTLSLSLICCASAEKAHGGNRFWLLMESEQPGLPARSRTPPLTKLSCVTPEAQKGSVTRAPCWTHLGTGRATRHCPRHPPAAAETLL